MQLLHWKPFNPDLSALLLRLVLGGLFVYHGYTKIISFDEILPHFKDIIGIGSKLSFILVIFAEFFLRVAGIAGLPDTPVCNPDFYYHVRSLFYRP
jgi:putative oxidoreductase